MSDEAGADVGAGARPILDDDLLTEALRQRFGDQTTDDVKIAAGRNGNDKTYWLCRIIERRSATR
jgi:hypothetical protein